MTVATTMGLISVEGRFEKPTVSPRSASEQVFNIAELLEQILLHLEDDNQTLLLCQCTSKAFQATIRGCTKLQQALFFVEVSTQSRNFLDAGPHRASTTEILEQILEKTDASTILSSRLVNKTFHALIASSSDLYPRLYGSTVDPETVRQSAPPRKSSSSRARLSGNGATSMRKSRLLLGNVGLCGLLGAVPLPLQVRW
ncbi:hypothetical protein CLAFUW4_12104 [Fulvia fulva]|uniref:F-box domain-containing protein n=1 Tax=Passalora fulva TaxID=5499 RepID=A0A9Q8PE52_PASFU|nr:uncharacterized protein CLAFUR5_11143 [Fulvia fulva]KAK4617685.1 hypothetical protein CLAFUR4_12109 [Fulvia fulva]KAK4618992.1 hypothetical protein CLAFUR0_12120 [Fulvia fulva]UJO20737.1 hypothetical protein CLAFUR5_11143 [Fulvia fulva]WPV18224.1 hypothetical protein CLAFUW4_12104 [Fulvia fulva]WPV32986.1 hypothetical protein CLAFUW7_12111 [Fulvia fulva]